MTSNPLKPSVALLVKLGSIAVHTDEMREYRFDSRISAFGWDVEALRTLLDDDEVKLWLTEMDALGFMPAKR